MSLLRDRYLSPLIRSRFKSEVLLLEKEVRRKLKKLKAIEKGLADRAALAMRAMEYKRAGDLLLANPQRIPRGAEKVALPYWTGEGYLMVDIELDPALSSARNAQVYYRKYRKSRLDDGDVAARSERVESSKRALSEFLSRLAETRTMAEIRILKDELKATAYPPLPRRGSGPVKEFNFRGFKVLDKPASRKVTYPLITGGLWFHARNPGAHVVVSAGKAPPGVINLPPPWPLIRSSQSWPRRYTSETREAHPGTISKSPSKNRTITVSPVSGQGFSRKDLQPGEEKT